MFNMRSRWEFVVGTDENGEVHTHWSVVSDEGEFTESEHGTVQGPLHTAIMAAYDGIGLTCPFMLDKDLLRWGGHETEEVT